MLTLENTTYDCNETGHIFGAWMPLDRVRVRRVCVIPQCREVETKRVTA